jgi:hypothetical protein
MLTGKLRGLLVVSDKSTNLGPIPESVSLEG